MWHISAVFFSFFAASVDGEEAFKHEETYLWYSEDASGKWSTSHQRMQPAFAGTRNIVASPFSSRVVSTLPREHRRVVNGSFEDQFVPGIYLYSDSQTPTLRM